MLGSLSFDLVQTHVVQFSLAILIAISIACATARRWPHLTFLLLMVVTIKCLIPPVIPSPAGVFTWSPALAFSPAISESEIPFEVAQQENELVAGYVPLTATGDTTFQLATWLYDNWPLLLFAVWAFGALFILGRAIVQMQRILTRLHHSSHLPSADVIRLAQQLKEKIGIKRPIRVFVSSDNLGPGCIGFFRPALIIPQIAVNHFPDNILKPILAHELVHIRRRDVIWGYLQFSAQVLWWFHPLVWILSRRTEMICERCVDEEVISSLGCSRADYGESLVRVLQLKRVLRPIPIGRQLSAAEVTTRRLQHLRGAERSFTPKTPFYCWAALALLAFTVLPGSQWTRVAVPSAPKLDWTAVHGEALISIKQQRWDEAAMLLSNLAIEPINEFQDCKTRFLLGYVEKARSNYDAAQDHLLAASDCYLLRGKALFLCGQIAAELGNDSEAIRFLEQAADSSLRILGDPGDQEQLTNLVGSSRFAGFVRKVQKHSRNKPGLATDLAYWIGTTAIVHAETSTSNTGFNVSVYEGQNLVHQGKVRELALARLLDVDLCVFLGKEGRQVRGNSAVLPQTLQIVSNVTQAGQNALQRITLFAENTGNWRHHVEQSFDQGSSWFELEARSHQPVFVEPEENSSNGRKLMLKQSRKSVRR